MSKITHNFPAPVPPPTTPVRRATNGSVDSVNANAAVGATQPALHSSTTAATPAIASDVPVDTAKVSKLRAAVLDGTYKPDAAKIAEKLVNLEKNLP